MYNLLALFCPLYLTLLENGEERLGNRKLLIKFFSPEAIRISRSPFFGLSMTHDGDCDS